MKKRLLPLLLTIVMVFVLSVVAVGANQGGATETPKQMWSHLTISEDGQTAVGYCPHCCDDPTQTVEWKLYTRTSGHNTLSTSGHYFLNASTSSNGALRPNVANLDFVLHLNGHTYERYAKSGNTTGVLFPAKDKFTFSIVDDQAQEGALSGEKGGWVVNNTYPGGKVVLYSGNLTTNVTTIATSGTNVNGGAVRMTAGTFEMYGGTVNGTKAVSGGAIYASGSSTYVKLHGGTINGGNATGVVETDGTVSGGGGVIYANAAKIEIDGTALIKNGTTAGSGGAIYMEAGASLTMTGGSIGELQADGTCANGATATKNGGSIYANASTVNVQGGTIAGGQTSGYGGNICSVGSTVTVAGGTVAGGTASKTGGNIFHEAANGIYISGGLVTGGVADDRGGNLYTSSVNSTVSVSGGTVTKGKALAKGTVDLTGGGGNIYANHGTLTITGGTISYGEGKYGGNICTNIGSNSSDKTAKIAYDATVSTAAPVITEGTATSNGGNIYAAEALEIGVATIENGEANYGGNVYAKKALTVGAATIKNGEATGGANLYTNAKTSLTGTTITGGEGKYGAAMYIGGGTVTIDAYISGGKATSRGGNIYVSAVTANITLNGGYVKDGVCVGDGTDNTGGGNIHVNNGVFTFAGGVVSGGKAPKGGNIYTNTGATDPEEYASAADDKLVIQGTTVIKDGEATLGGNLYIGYNVILGAGTFENGKAEEGSDIYVGPKANLTVDAAFNGEAGIFYSLNQLPNPIPGGMICANKNKAADAHIEINRNTGVFTGKLYLENDPSLPYIYAKEGDDKLYITGIALVDGEGKYTWFTNNADAVAAYAADDAYLLAAEGALVLDGGNYVVDLAGNDVQITGSGNVTIFDSANDDYKTYGSATIEGPILQNTFKTAVEGKDTYMVEKEGVYSFHRIGIRIAGVSVRPSAAGMYYTGRWMCDELLAEEIKTFGVAVSLIDMPTAEFLSDQDTLYTAFDKENFENGVTKTGVLITDIVKDGAKQNTARSKRDIFASAYVIFADGTVAVNDQQIAYSLFKTMELIEENLYDYAAKVDKLKEFHDTWVEAGVEWDMDFQLTEDEKQLHSVYSGRQPYHGEAHDHGATGGNSDGNYTLGQWEAGMESLNMDFATLVDHRQVNHMYLPEWDTNKFIGGSEASTLVQGEGYETDKNKMHYNMIFTDPKGLEAVVSSFAPFNYTYSSTKGIYVFSYPNLTPDQIREVIQLVKDNGGMFTHVHPKSGSYIQSDDPLMYWFADWTGLEVFYGYGGYAPTRSVTNSNYKLWTDLLAAGKKVWATAGSDKHSAPNTDALTTIYAEEANANSYFSHMKVGDTTCGPVGVRMCVGDTLMGSETDFEGKRLVFCVDDFHERAYDATHTYHAELISDTGVVDSVVFDASQPFYYGIDADDTAKFYRVEVFDDTLGLRIAIGNPIWNQ